MDTQQSNNQPPILLLKNISKKLGGTQLLDGLSFSLNKGESVAILGESGSGKSTLLHLMAGLEPPDDGHIFWSGQRIDQLTVDDQATARLSHIGLVFQAFYLLPHLTALQNVQLPFLLAGKPVMAQHCNNLLESVGMQDKASQMPRELSGGEQQRVAIARALALSPPLILADEPTGNLDEANATKVLEVLLHACETHNCGLVMVTHSLDVARKLGQQLRLKAGHLGLFQEED